MKKMKRQMTKEQAIDLIRNWRRDYIKTILIEMDNHIDIEKKNKSVGMTCSKWLNINRKRFTPLIAKKVAVQKAELFTWQRAQNWLYHLNIEASEFETYFDYHSDDEKTGKKLFFKRLR